MQFLVVILVFFVVFFGLVWFFLYFRQEKMIFQAEKLPKHFVFNFPGTYDELTFKSEGNVHLHALHFKNKNSKGIVFYFHGNAGSLASWGQWATLFQKYEFDVLMYDYRSYGKSTGKISNEAQIHRDALVVYKEVIGLYTGKRVVFYGRSLGTGIAAKLATIHEPESLILTTPYFNFTQQVKSMYSFIPVRALLKYKFKTNEYLPLLKCPVYLIHGTDDELVPYESSLMLEKLGDHIHLTTIKGGTHGDLPNFKEFRDVLKKALT